VKKFQNKKKEKEKRGQTWDASRKLCPLSPFLTFFSITNKKENFFLFHSLSRQKHFSPIFMKKSLTKINP